MVSKACIVGQYQTKLEALARHRDLELSVVVPPYWRDERGVIPLERTHTHGYDLIVLPLALQGHFHLYFFPGLSKLIQRLQPDLVHIDEEPYNVATLLGLRSARQINAKTAFFTWQNIERRYPVPFSWIEAYSYRNTDLAIAGNQEAAQVLRRKGFARPVQVIPQFGVDPESFCPSEKPPLSGAPFRVGYAGRLVTEKGLPLLLQAVAGLEGDWELVILGGGPLRETLEAQTKQIGISKRVTFQPSRPSSQLPEFYRQLDLFVLPSISRPNWKEQFGRVLIEAMASGVPVVGSTSGEIPQIIGDAGLLFPEGDVQALRSQIDSMRRDPGRRADFARRGRARILDHFTQDQVAEETYSAYRAAVMPGPDDSK